MKKIITLSALIIALLLSLFFVSCGSKNDTTDVTTGKNADDTSPAMADEVRILGLKGPTGMGLATVINDAGNDPDSRYKVTVMNSPDLVKAEVLLGKYDIAALPTNVAAALYNSGKADFKIAAVNTLGVLYILENGNTVTDINSLKGKTIYATGGGSTPEYILRYILSENGIDPDKDVTLDFSFTEHSELAAYIAGGANIIAMLPEPNVTTTLMSNPEIRVALDITEEWGKVSDSDVMQGCIVVRSEFAEKYPEQLAMFLDDYRASIEYVNEHPDEASVMIANAGIIPKAEIAKSAIERCNIVYVEGTEMSDKLSDFFEVLYDADPSSVGGKLPDNDIFLRR